jgi:hypothetical protein
MNNNAAQLVHVSGLWLLLLLLLLLLRSPFHKRTQV